MGTRDNEAYLRLNWIEDSDALLSVDCLIIAAVQSRQRQRLQVEQLCGRRILLR